MSVLVSLQLALYALLWALGSVALKQERPAIVQWVGYALASAAATALLAWRPEGPVWVTHTGASLANLLSLILAGRGVVLFLGLRPQDRLFMVVGVVALVVLGWIGPHDAPARVAVAATLNILVIASVFVQVRQAFAREFGVRMAVVATLPALALVCMNLYFLVQGLLRGPVAIVGPGVVPLATWVVTLVSAAAFNYLFLFLVGFRMQQNLHRMASNDVLTRLPNRRAMEQRLQLEWDRSQRYGKPFVVISVDVDHFKRINDEHGHAMGDQALIAIANALQAAARDTDHVSRFGGEEFMVLMPEAHTERDGMPLAERLRTAITQLSLTSPTGQEIRLSASFGVSGWLASDKDREHVLRRADGALYEAKSKGRNCVVLHAGNTPVSH